MSAAYVGFVALSATVVLILLLAPLARRVGLVDSPRGHKTHEGDVPLVGGIAIFCGFVLAVLVSQIPLHELRPLLAGAALLVAIGALDDFKELGPETRFAAQIAAAATMVLWGQVELRDLGQLLGPEPAILGDWSLPFTVFAVVGVVNALNMLDGMDGLAGALALAAFLLLGVLAQDAGDATAALALFALAAATLGFLVFNLRLPGRARGTVFMGDAGSMLLGFALAWFLVDLSQAPTPEQRPVIAPVTALWIVALPLLDTVAIMLRRILHGRSPLRPDREHLHHLLRRAGFRSASSLIVILAATVALATLGLLAEAAGVPEYVLFGAFLSLFVCYLVGMEMAWRLLGPQGFEFPA